MAKGSSKSKKQLKFWQKVSNFVFEIWLFFPLKHSECMTEIILSWHLWEISHKNKARWSVVFLFWATFVILKTINSWECFCKIGFWSVNSTNFAIFWEKFAFDFTKLKKQKTKYPIDEIKTGCGWMDVVDAYIKTVDEKIPQPPPDFRSASMQLRSLVATGGPRLAPRVFSLCLEPRPWVLHSSLSLVKITWELHAICCCVKKISSKKVRISIQTCIHFLLACLQ